MSWIREDLVPADARWAQANIIRCMSIDPPMPMMKAVAGLNRVITFGGSTLSRAQEALIATAVSTINRCRYGTISHRASLRQVTDDTDFANHAMPGGD